MRGISGNNNIIIFYDNKIKIVKVSSLLFYMNKYNYILTPTYSHFLEKPSWSKIESVSFQKDRLITDFYFVNNFNIEASDNSSFLYLSSDKKKFSQTYKNSNKLIYEYENKKSYRYVGFYSKIPINFKEDYYYESVLLGISLTDYSYISSKYIQFKIRNNKEKVDFIINLLKKLNIKYILKKQKSLFIIRINNVYNFSLKKNNYCDFPINYLGFLEGFINISSIILIENRNKIPYLFVNSSYHHIMNLLILSFLSLGIRVSIKKYNNLRNYYEVKSSDRNLIYLFNNIFLRRELKKCLNNEKINYIYKNFYVQNIMNYSRKRGIIYNIKLENSNNILVGRNGFVPIISD